MSEAPLPDFPHAEPQGNIHTQVAMEALEVGEFLGKIHRAAIAYTPARTFVHPPDPWHFRPPLPFLLLARIASPDPRGEAVRVSSVDREATSVEIDSGLRLGCPECGANLQHAGGCTRCAECGYSQCE